jgi:hypothetical protein
VASPARPRISRSRRRPACRTRHSVEHNPLVAAACLSRRRTVRRAPGQLGISHIAAYSPQARGRSERAFGTLHDRLPKELRLAGITGLEAANQWIAQTYIAAHNAAFAVAPEQQGTAFVPDRAGLAPDILCIQEERQVGNDNTVKWDGRSLQIPPSPGRPHFVRATVRVHEYPDGSLAVFHGPRCLGRYTADGTPLETSRAAA